MGGVEEARSRVLFITKLLPEGPLWGGLIRTEAILRALRSRFDVRVMAYEPSGRRGPRPRLASVLNAYATRRPYQMARWIRPGFERRVRDEVARFRPDVLHVEYTQLAPLALAHDLPRVLDMHNVESFFAAGVAATSGGVAARLARRDAPMLQAFERSAAEHFDLVVVSSREEADRASCPTEIVPNGVYPSREPLDVAPDPDLLCFVGQFAWLSNIEGAEWLVQRVLPLLPSRLGIRLVGREPDRRVRALAGPRVEVTGSVPDVWPHVARAGLVVAPILNAGGTRLKVLEGLLAERPVLATPQAADGLRDLEGRGLVVAETPEAFARAADELTSDPVRAAELGRLGRRAVVADYDWEGIGARLLELYATRLGVR
jgi:polysaccharide biosynthesis protein PslH